MKQNDETDVDVRESAPDDLPAIEALYADAFPDEDLLVLVRSLLRETPGVLSCVATIEGSVVGHVAFTGCSIAEGRARFALLAPLAVASTWQKRGIGSALVKEGLRRLESSGVDRVFVLGDPAYYRRFGFLPETAVEPPYPLPREWREAWQAITLRNEPLQRGRLRVPPAWRRPALWGP